MSIKRETRLARQADDDGAPDDEVWAVNNTSSECYHDDPDCRNLALEKADTITREQAQRRWKGPCLDCIVNGGGDE